MSTSYQPKPTTPLPTGVTSIVLRGERKPSVDSVQGSFNNTFGGYVPPEWTLDAECTQPGTDPEIFFPSRGGRRNDDAAAGICAVCVVRDECLEDALSYETGQVGADDVRPEVHGFRAGLTEKERRRIVQKHNTDKEAETRVAVVKDYAAGLLQVDEIAEKHGVNVNTVSRWAREDGVPMRTRKGGRQKGSAA